MLKIGITGGIGTGKSTVCKLFNLLNIPSIDADKVAKKLLSENELIKTQIIALFGSEAYVEDKLNNAWIASKTFSDPKMREQLNAIVHPPTIAYMNDWFEMHKKQNLPYVIKEAAIMIETGSYKEMDLIIGVQSPMLLRIQRIQLRNQWTVEEVESRMNAQMAENLKAAYYDFTILNDEQSSLIQQVAKIHQRILNKI